MRIRHLVGSSAPGADPIRIQNSATLKWLRGLELSLWPSMANLR